MERGSEQERQGNLQDSYLRKVVLRFKELCPWYSVK